MAAITQTAGPVSTPQSINWNWKFQGACASTDEFLAAATALEQAGFGHVASYKANLKGGRDAKVYIKGKPEDVMPLLCANPDLCDPEIYQQRYAQLPPKSIGLQLRTKLVSLKLVSQKQMM